MADTGAKVLLVDCDLRKPKMHKYFSVEGAVGLTNLLIGQVKPSDVIQRWGRKHLDLLPAGQVPPNPSELLGSDAMKKFLAKAEKDYDVVLMDSAPLLPVTDAAILSKITGGVAIVVAVGKTTKPQLSAALGHIDAIGGRVTDTAISTVPTGLTERMASMVTVSMERPMALTPRPMARKPRRPKQSQLQRRRVKPLKRPNHVQRQGEPEHLVCLHRQYMPLADG